MSEARGDGGESRTARLDRAIDGAVREMLDVEPRADLRERVIARLPAAGSWLPAFGVRLPALGFRLVLVTAALVVFAVFVARREPVAPEAPLVAHRGDQRLAAPVAPAPAAVSSQRLAARTPVVATPRESVPTVARAATPKQSGFVVATSVNEEVTATGIEPLDTIEAIAVGRIAHERIDQERIAPGSIAVRPLNAIPEIQIAPLTPADRRN